MNTTALIAVLITLGVSVIFIFFMKKEFDLLLSPQTTTPATTAALDETAETARRLNLIVEALSEISKSLPQQTTEENVSSKGLSINRAPLQDRLVQTGDLLNRTDMNATNVIAFGRHGKSGGAQSGNARSDSGTKESRLLEVSV